MKWRKVLLAAGTVLLLPMLVAVQMLWHLCADDEHGLLVCGLAAVVR